MDGQYLIYGLIGIVILVSISKVIKVANKNNYKWDIRSCHIICSKFYNCKS